MNLPSSPSLAYAQKYKEIIRRVFPCYEELQSLVAKQIVKLCPEKILLVGAGVGEEISFLRESGYLPLVDALEPNEHMSKIAKEQLALSKSAVTWFETDWLQFDLQDKKYNLISCQLVLHFVKEKETWLSKMNSALKPGGYLFISFFCGSFSDEICLEEWEEWRKQAKQKVLPESASLVEKDFSLIKKSAYIDNIDNMMRLFFSCGFVEVEVILKRNWLYVFKVRANELS